MKRRSTLLRIFACCAAVGLSTLLLGACGEPDAVATPPPAGDVASVVAAAPKADPWAVPASIRKPSLRFTRFETIALPDELGTKRTTCVLVEGDRLVVGTERGLAVREDGAWRLFGVEQGMGHGYVTSLARQRSNDALWIGTLAGLCRLSGGAIRTWTQSDSGLMNDVVYHVALDGDRVWVATAAGTSAFETRTGRWALWSHENSIMHEPWCYALARGAGRTWIGVWGGGIVERDDATGLWREYRDPDGEMELDLLVDDGPIHDVTSFVAWDAGVLWQGTYFGLSRYDGRRWRTYTADDTGLPSDFVHHVSARGHTVALSTDQGFAMFDGTTCVAYRRLEDGRCDVRVVTSGREVERTTLPTAHADDYVLWSWLGDDEIWLATGRGLSHGILDSSTTGDE